MCNVCKCDPLYTISKQIIRESQTHKFCINQLFFFTSAHEISHIVGLQPGLRLFLFSPSSSTTQHQCYGLNALSSSGMLDQTYFNIYRQFLLRKNKNHQNRDASAGALLRKRIKKELVSLVQCKVYSPSFSFAA